jgi:hypothetical protein
MYEHLVSRSYAKEKYLELLFNAAESVLGYFGLDGSLQKILEQ